MADDQPRRPARRLHSLIIKEISAVHEGANEDARMDIIKSKEADMAAEDHDPENGGEEYTAEEAEFLDEVAEELEALNESGELVEAVASMILSLDEATETVGKMAEQVEERNAVIAKMAPIVEEHDKLKGEARELLAKVRDMQNPPAEDSDEAIMKSMGPVAGAKFIEMRKAHEANEAREAIAKARALGVGNANELGPLLTRIRKGKTDAKDADAIETLLKSCGAAIAKGGITAPIGGAEIDDGGDIYIAKAKAGATEIMKAHPTLTEAQAITKFWNENPALYQEMRQAQRTNRAA